MNSREWKKAYHDLNSSFGRRFIFRLGADAGFYSEFNNLILGVVYSLIHKINFKVQCERDKIFYKRGWSDYFKPFLTEVNYPALKKYNVRPYMLRGNTYKYVPQIIKKLYNISYLTQDLFDCFHNKEFEKAVLYESKLNLSGNLLDVTKVIIKNVYQFNEEIDRIITSEIEKYQLPSKYIAVHIRKGDKTNETDVLNSEKYIEYILRNFKTEDIFVFTDSYDVITELNLLYPHLNFLTLTSENEFGYFHPDFIKLSPVVRKNSIIKMFINLEIINKAQYFVGTYDSNIGMFVGMRTGGKNCFDVLNRPWMIW